MGRRPYTHRYRRKTEIEYREVRLVRKQRNARQPNTSLPYMQTTKRRTCKKKSYSLREAERRVIEYNHRVVFGTLSHYWCWRHKAWHVGHSNKRLASSLALMGQYGKW